MTEEIKIIQDISPWTNIKILRDAGIDAIDLDTTPKKSYEEAYKEILKLVSESATLGARGKSRIVIDSMSCCKIPEDKNFSNLNRAQRRAQRK